jgi:hypothetical protein
MVASLRGRMDFRVLYTAGEVCCLAQELLVSKEELCYMSLSMTSRCDI